MDRTEEYLFLREEIIKNYSYIEKYRDIMYTVTLAILTIAFNQNEPLIFLLPLLIDIPIYKITIDKTLSICKNSMYLAVFLEGENFQWETKLYEYDKKFSHPKAKGNSVNVYLYSIIVISCAILSILHLNFCDIFSTHTLLRIICIIVSTVLSLVFIKKWDINYEIEKEKCKKNWECIKSKSENK